MTSNDIIYFELNNWSPDEDYPPEQPYIDWCCFYKKEDCTYHLPELRNDEWVKENELVVVETPLDMSMNFCISATRKWVEDNCQNLLTKWSKFIRVPEEGDDLPYGRWDAPFLPYTKENFGYHYAEEDDDGNWKISD